MNLIEKVARAIAISQGSAAEETVGNPAGRWNAFTHEMEDQPFPIWHDFIPDARAALDAIAEPSEAMYAAGQDALQQGHAADEIFRRMIAKGREG